MHVLSIGQKFKGAGLVTRKKHNSHDHGGGDLHGLHGHESFDGDLDHDQCNPDFDDLGYYLDNRDYDHDLINLDHDFDKLDTLNMALADLIAFDRLSYRR